LGSKNKLLLLIHNLSPVDAAAPTVPSYAAAPTVPSYAAAPCKRNALNHLPKSRLICFTY